MLKTLIQKIKEGRVKGFIEETIWVYSYVKAFWLEIILYTLIGFAGVVFSLLSSFVSRDVVDIITGHQTGEVVKYFVMMVGYAVASLIVSQVSGYLSSWIQIRVDNKIRSDLYEKILVTDWESITKYHSGDLQSRWASDSSVISSGVLSWVPNLVVYSFRFFSALFVVASNDWTFAVISLLGFPFSLFISRSLMNKMRENNDKAAAMNAKMSSFNQESFSNIQIIKSFNLVGAYVHQLRELQVEYKDMKMTYQKFSMVTSIIMACVSLAISYFAYGWGIYRVWSGAITYGTMTMFLTLSNNLTGTLSSLTDLVPSAVSIATSARRMMDVLDMPKEDYSGLEEAREFEKKYAGEGISLYMQDLSYTYHAGTEVFKNANFEAHPHEIVALVGPSGEGKTTMLRLILSVLRPQGGSCYVAGGEGYIRVKDSENRYGSQYESYHAEKKSPTREGERLSLSASTRLFFSYVPQGNTMFSGTIAGNMRTVKPDATDDEIIEVLKAACAYEFVEKMPEGINSEIKERGGGISEGQAQRLSIARALLLKAPILLLDEATSALDVKTERRVLRSIMNDNYPRTVIVTTHRPTVLSMCQRVYNIENKMCRVLSEEEIELKIRDF